MFFRREKTRIPSFDDHLAALKPFGIEVQPLGADRTRASRQGIAATLENVPGKPPTVREIGLVVGKEIAELWSGGFQMFFATPSGKKTAARAEQLTALHAFEEDLKAGLGIESLYNESLGTTSAHHMYDRVEERDDTRPKKPWEVKIELSKT
jgi:hypothetical protein